MTFTLGMATGILLIIGVVFIVGGDIDNNTDFR